MEEQNIDQISHRIERGEKTKVKVLGKVFFIGDTKRNIINRINDITYKVKFYEGKENIRGMRRRMKFVNTADARISSLLLLNAWANIPFLHAIHWRVLNKKYTTETFSAIISIGLNNEEFSFFLKNSVLCQNLLTTRMMTMQK